MDNSIGLRRELHNFPMLDREQQKWATMSLHLPTSSDYAREGKLEVCAPHYDILMAVWKDYVMNLQNCMI